MIKTTKLVSAVLVTVLATVFTSGCDYLGIKSDVSEYVETVQETAADNEELKVYIEELRPILSEFYKDGKTLNSLEVKGNEINIEIDLGASKEPYESFQDLMVYETTRLTHSIYTYRSTNEVIHDIYRININFLNQKVVTLYGKQATEVNGYKEFNSKTVLDAVKR